MKKRSSLENEIIITTTKFTSVVVFIVFLSVIIIGCFALPVYVKIQKINTLNSISEIIGKDYYLGDLVSIKSTFDAWSSRENSKAVFYDVLEQVIWKSENNDEATKSYFDLKFNKEVKHQDQLIGKISGTYNFKNEFLNFVTIITAFLIISMALLWFLILFQNKSIKKSLIPLNSLRDSFQINSTRLGFYLSPSSADDILDLQRWFNEVSEAWKKENESARSLAQIEGIIKLAKQVAHDIRSPLSALNIITSTLTDIPEEKRLLIRNSVQRINDIANDLLQKSKSSARSAAFINPNVHSLNKNDDSNIVENDLSKNQKNNFLISTVIDNIISEKRIQFREKINIHINVDLKNSFGLFVKANPNELSRVISNLINNSVEALPHQSGNVDISVFSNSENKICIQIKDNGSGIPKHILEKLGQAGVTHGKDNSQSGSGLGVYHAIKTIQEFGGQIKFQSVTTDDIRNTDRGNTNQESAIGTTITIELPKADTPTWFAESIQLKPGQEIVTVDDDISIHQIWKGRLESLKANEQNIKLTSFTSAKEFREYFNKHLKFVFNTSNDSTGINSDKYSRPDSTVVFLIDYEFLNQNDNGLKIITDLGMQDKAILVTSRFDEPNIRSECEAQKIKILPKQLAGQITISIMPSSVHSTNEIVLFAKTDLSKTESTINNHPVSKELSKYDLCLIDDDKLLVHSIWGMVAKEKGLNIRMFERPEDFLSEARHIDKTTPVYVDVSLANNVNGIDVANTIYKQGFENINLATGYDSETIKTPSFIRQVVGKDFPL